MTKKTIYFKLALTLIAWVFCMPALPVGASQCDVLVYPDPSLGACGSANQGKTKAVCYVGDVFNCEEENDAPAECLDSVERLLGQLYTPMDACGACGDGACTVSELTSCPQDCVAACGDGVCNYPEAVSCGPDSYSGCIACGSDCGLACCDNVCEGDETISTCPQDCQIKEPCGNGTCESFENTVTCPWDCAVCGDNSCNEPVESADNCPADCL